MTGLTGEWSNEIIVSDFTIGNNPYINEINLYNPRQIYVNTFDAGQWKNEAEDAHHLTNVGAVLETSGGPAPNITHYVNLDGIDDYLDTPHHADLNVSRPACHGIWVWIPTNYGDSDDWACWFSKGTGSYEWRRDSSSAQNTRWSPTAGHGLRDELPPFGEWVFYGMGIESDGTNRLYRRTTSDETMQSLTAESGTLLADYTTSSNPFAIGRRGSGERHVNGRVAGYFMVPDAMLTVAQFDAIYDAAFASVGPENAYLIFRRTPPTGQPFDPEVDTPIAEVPPEQLTYDDEGLAEGEYDWQVFARKVD